MPQRMLRLPALMQTAALGYFGASPTRGFVESFMRLTRGLPNGLFDNGAIASYLARQFSQPGRTDDFRKLAHKLYIVATDLDSGKAVPFGAPGFDDAIWGWRRSHPRSRSPAGEPQAGRERRGRRLPNRCADRDPRPRERVRKARRDFARTDARRGASPHKRGREATGAIARRFLNLSNLSQPTGPP